VQLASGPPIKLSERPIAVIQDISPEYFRTMAVALKRGRDFTAHDNAQNLPVAIVNENLARTFLPEYPGGSNPIGQRVLIGTDPKAVEIVGIVPNVRYSGRDDNPMPEVYMPCAQKPPGVAMLAVRTEGDPLSLANAVRGQVLAMDHDQPVSAVASMDELVETSEGQLRLMMRLLGIFAGAAALLAVVGLYGVVSYSVVQRTKEIGVRRALGAQRGDILSLMAKQAVKLALVGVVIGVGGAFALTRLLQDLLFRVSATDPVTFVAIPVLFVLVAVAASYIPARRAAAIDPMAALRIG
jgi:putative ABC transport system permease protein